MLRLAGSGTSNAAAIDLTAQPAAAASASSVDETLALLLSCNLAANLLQGLPLLKKLLTNAATKPESKFKRVRIANPALQRKLWPVAGALELLLSLGFERQQQEGADWLVISDEGVQMHQQAIQHACELIQSELAGLAQRSIWHTGLRKRTYLSGPTA